MKVAQNEQLTVVDQHVAERRMALQKTKELHKQLLIRFIFSPDTTRVYL